MHMRINQTWHEKFTLPVNNLNEPTMVGYNPPYAEILVMILFSIYTFPLVVLASLPLKIPTLLIRILVGLGLCATGAVLNTNRTAKQDRIDFILLKV